MIQALNVKQVAELLNVNERTIYKLAQKGELPAFRVSGSWRFLPDDIMGWIDEQKSNAKEALNKSKR